MTTLKELKAKYSGQAVPEWELIAAGLKPDGELGETQVEQVKRRGRPPKAAEEARPEPEQDGE